MERKIIKLGSNYKDDIIVLQKRLVELGYSLKIDGDFGRKTDIAVKDFQERESLVPDGIVGSKTWKALFPCEVTQEDLRRAASNLGVDVATIKAVMEVESRGSGFLSPGKPVILFEGHIFWNELKKAGYKSENYTQGNEDILYPKWDKSHYLGGIKEYYRLEKAEKIDEVCALKSASWGLFQIMGFNYKVCGCDTVTQFVDLMKESEGSQLDLFVEFIKGNSLESYLRNLDWAGFAKKYNGPAYRENKYDEKLEKAYEKYKS